MRILNRVIAAGVLVVPMVLGASGVAVADVAAGNSVLPTQSGASEDGSSDNCDEEGGLLRLLGGGDDSDDGECGGKDGKDDNGPLG